MSSVSETKAPVTPPPTAIAAHFFALLPKFNSLALSAPCFKFLLLGEIYLPFFLALISLSAIAFPFFCKINGSSINFIKGLPAARQLPYIDVKNSVILPAPVALAFSSEYFIISPITV